MSTNFETISWQSLNTVTGGKASSTDSTATALAGIQDSLKSLASDSGKKSGLGDPTTMLMLVMCMANQNKGGSNTTVVAGGGYAAPAQCGYSVRTRTSVRW